MKLKLERPLIFFDLESTGTSTSKDKIVEISVTKFFPDRDPEVKTHKINPQMHIPEGSSKVHGIYDDDVKDKPFFGQYAESMYKYFEGCDIAGYNLLRFDIPLLREEFLRCGIDWPDSDVKIIDVYQLICVVFPRNLSHIYNLLVGRNDEKFKKETKENAHNAEFDNMMTFEVLSRLIDKEEAVCVTPSDLIPNTVEGMHNVCNEFLGNYVDYAGKIIVNKSGDYVFDFGMHKGELLYDNKPYCQWMLVNDFAEDTKRAIMKVWNLKNVKL